MKNILRSLLLKAAVLTGSCILFSTALLADVTLTTSPVAAANIAQGASNTIAYVVKMDVTVAPVTVNNMQFTLDGTYDNNDLSGAVSVYFNATAPTLSGAILVAGVGTGFAAPHVYSTGLVQPIAAGSSGYFIITFNLSASATAGNTIKVNGLTNPVVFVFTTTPTVTNNQTDAAGVQTIIAGVVTLSSSPVAAANIAQGAANTVAYIVKMDVSGSAITVNNMQFTLGGTYDNNDLSAVSVYFNATAPTLSGAIIVAGVGIGFAAPHIYSAALTQPMAAGSSGYFLITFSLNAAATAGNTIKVDGLANPVVFSFATSPTVTNNQTDAAGVQTIQAAGVTLSSPVVPAANILPGSNNNIVYAVKMDVTSLPVTANNIQFTLSGTYDNNDLSGVSVYFNTTAPTLSGATVVAGFGVGFAAPHTYSTTIAQPIAAGGSGYFIVTCSLSGTATGGNTIQLDGTANPVVFSFATAPPVTNNQTNAAGVQTFTSTLPVTLIDFTGKTADAQTQLQWNTSGELNTKAFDIEWSADGTHFNTIATIAAGGNNLSNKQYSYIHSKPVEGNNFYRLKMTDNNGQFTYSWVIKIKLAAVTNAITVFPNPVADMLQITLQSDKNAGFVARLHRSDGKLMAAKNFTVVKGSNSLNWNLQQLAPGTYFISFENHVFETVRIFKQ